MSQTSEPSPAPALPRGVTVKDGRYYVTPTIGGKRKWIGLSRVEAGIPALFAELDKLNPDRPPPNVSGLLQRFAREGQGHRRDSTWAKYKQTIESPDSKLAQYFGHMKIESVRPSHVAT